MARKRTNSTQQIGKQSHRTPTFLLALPLLVEDGQSKRLRAHLEAGRGFYNALLYDQFPALIDWDDPVVKHGLDRASPNMPAQGLRKASSPQAQGADRQGSR